MDAARDKFSRATVNDVIDAHSQINASNLLKINTPSTLLSLYWTTLSNKHPLSNRRPHENNSKILLISKIKRSRIIFSFLLD